MPQFSDVLRLLNQLKAEHVVVDYAIGGAMAASFWDEPLATQDLDVVVTLDPSLHPLDPPSGLFDWLRGRGCAIEGEHVQIAGVPVQFLSAWSALVREAVGAAADISYDPQDPAAPTMRVIRPTYLVAMWEADASALTSRRKERVARLRDAGLVDEALLSTLQSRHGK